MTDLAKLAAGLTEAQRRAIMHFDDKPKCTGKDWVILIDLGLIEFERVFNAVLTHLGISLRRHLLDQEKKG